MMNVHLEYGRVIDMCKGTKVKPWECVKVDGKSNYSNHPAFHHDSPDDYSFAVAILENKPVFVGDTIYDTSPMCIPYRVTEHDLTHPGYSRRNMGDISDDSFSWHPPRPTRRTFTLNGVELPCPNKSGSPALRIIGFNQNNYYFANGGDLRRVEDAINKLLQGATK